MSRRSDLVIPSYDSLDEAVVGILSKIDDEGELASPRGMTTKEVLHVGFQLQNPRARLVLNEERKWSLPLAIGELVWHLAGSNDVSALSYYARRWRDYTRGSVISGSCYGFKLFRNCGGAESQWQRALRELTADRDSRRAVVHLHDGAFDPGSPDVACASLIQFLVRNDRLHATVYMRSNDAFWGLPYDCFLFTVLQELMARELNLDLGTYTHFATSMHVYEQHFQQIKKVIAGRPFDTVEMPPLQRPDQVPSVVAFEHEIRIGAPRLDFEDIAGYWSDLLLVLSHLKATRTGNEDVLRNISEHMANTPYAALLTQ